MTGVTRQVEHDAVMRVLLAPDRFDGTLSAVQAARALAEGWSRHAPADELTSCPLSDGGPGFLDVLRVGLPGRLEAVTVTGPLGDPVPAGVLLVDGDPADGDPADGDPAAGPAAGGAAGVRTAYVESAQACGLHLVPPDRRDPGRATTRGVGELLAAARAAGARRIVVGLGGAGTHDGGAGALAALAPTGAGRSDRLTGGGAALRGITAADLGWLPALRQDWSGVELVVATDVDIALLGFHGASAELGRGPGTTPEQAQELERCLGDLAAAASTVLSGSAAPDGSGPVPRAARPAAEPGAGAAGGLGFGLLLLGGRRVPGTTAVTDTLGLTDRLRGSDLVVTGQGCFDWQSLRGTVVAGVARAALDVGTPVVVVAGQVLVGRREAQAIGVESAYPVARTPAEVAAALADPYGTLAARAHRVARTWSR